VVFDSIIGAFTLGSAISNVVGVYVTPLSVAITVLSVLAIVGAVLAAREVARQGRERTVVIVTLIIVIILLSLLPGGWFAALVPVVVIASFARPRAKPPAPEPD
jgi:predicted MFS family arabinose efflux permease